MFWTLVSSAMFAVFFRSIVKDAKYERRDKNF